MKKSDAGGRLAVYAGTFDPITNGHRDIIMRALGVFERLHIAVVTQPRKVTLLPPEERAALVTGVVRELGDKFRRRVVVKNFGGLLVDYVKQVGANVIVRGLRAVSDYEYEAQMAILNRHLATEIETVFLMTSDHCSFISSSVVREIAKNGGDVSGLVPKRVAKRLEQIYSSER